MNEYAVECEKQVKLDQLAADYLPTETYAAAHEGLIIVCHDVFVQMDSGILLVKRLSVPAKDILWPLGGRINRGMSVEDSLCKRVREEASIELDEIVELGIARTYFSTDPFGHGRGTDTLNIVYMAKAVGEVKLDKFHEAPTVVRIDDYLSLRDGLHPYVSDFMDLVLDKMR